MAASIAKLLPPPVTADRPILRLLSRPKPGTLPSMGNDLRQQAMPEEAGVEDDLKWATEGATCLRQVRRATQADFAAVMEGFKGNQNRGQEWFHEGKSCIIALYHYAEEFAPDPVIPGATFSSPQHFSQRLDEYDAFVTSMQQSMYKALEPFRTKGAPSVPYEASALLDLLNRVSTAIAYVRKQSPQELGPSTDDARTIVERAARQFHEAVLAMRTHPHGGTLFAVSDEWDCQYLFRAILASLVHDVRIEEWNPSVAGSAARCEFLLKSHRLMIELKFARRKADLKKFKTELLTDLRDYGSNPEVEVVVVLVYDPNQVLESAVQLQRDLSGPTNGLNDVSVIVSPPRSAHGI